jgi:hypothetical protein
MCLINEGVDKDCKYSFGGLSAIYLANTSDIQTYNLDSDGMITGITMVSGKTFYDFKFERGTGSFTNELQVSNGNRYFNQSVSMTLSGLNQAKLNVMERTGLANIVAICKDRRGKAFVLGLNAAGDGLEASVLSANSGAAEGDMYGISVTLTGTSDEIGNEVDTSILAALLPA